MSLPFDINDLTIKQLREIATLASTLLGTPCAVAPAMPVDTALELGKSYLFFTVTKYVTGRITRIVGPDIVLEDAAWVAYTGRLTDALKKEAFDEVEPYPHGAILQRAVIVDVVPLSKLPTKVCP